jgi:hypothetical protein
LIFAAVAYFLLKFDGGYRSRARPYLLGAVGTLFGAWSVWIIVMMTPYYLGRIWVSPDAVFGPAISAGDIAATMLCVLVSVDVWRHVGRESRQRLRWLFFAVALALAGFTLVVLADLLGITQTSQTAVLAFQVAADIAYGAAVLALIYAVLRHRVMDIGLAVSRTLVFAIFSGLLLFLFGTVEWLLDHFLHFEQRERSFLLDGVIAVGVYAAFHRARDGIQSVVERVFFREWHAREAALQHFLETTPHFSDADALADALLAAVDAYTGSPGSGIYRRNDAGSFILDKSKLDHLPQELGSDASLIIELKASRTPYYFARVGDAATTLAVPMVRRSELVGFLVVAQKADCTLYRPAEIDNLVRAIHQVSSDLYALRVERLERRQRELEQQNEALRQQFRSLAVSEPRNS